MSALTVPKFATQLVGSWCKPHWMCDHEKVYDAEGTWWRVDSQQLEEAHDDAVRLAIADQERAGLTYVTDGEQRRKRSPVTSPSDSVAWTPRPMPRVRRCFVPSM